MKQVKPVLIFTFFLIISGFSIDTYYDSVYTPVLMKREDLEKSIKLMESKDIKVPGKIYAKDNYLFISEKYEGIHVIDNSDPSKPVNTGFINVPGCIDIAIKGTSMYVDNAVDLVAIELSEYPKITVNERVTNIFPEILPPGYDYMPNKYLPGNRPSKTIIVKWIRRGESI